MIKCLFVPDHFRSSFWTYNNHSSCVWYCCSACCQWCYGGCKW